jgi:hypothetical protein
VTRTVIEVALDDPVYQIYCWRNDSARLFVLQPVLDLAMEMPEQPCVLGQRYACRPQSCSPCLIFDLQNRMRRSIT